MRERKRDDPAALPKFDNAPRLFACFPPFSKIDRWMQYSRVAVRARVCVCICASFIIQKSYDKREEDREGKTDGKKHQNADKPIAWAHDHHRHSPVQS